MTLKSAPRHSLRDSFCNTTRSTIETNIALRIRPTDGAYRFGVHGPPATPSAQRCDRCLAAIAALSCRSFGAPDDRGISSMGTERKLGTTVNQSFSAGRDATGVVQTVGDGNTVNETVTVTSGIPPEVITALDAIALALSVNPSTRVLAVEAAKEAKADAPDKGTIAGHLSTALTVAKTLPDWLDIARKVAPAVQTAATWLGAQGAALFRLLP
jgi:hypothetical protein